MNSTLYTRCPVCHAEIPNFQTKVKKSTSENHFRRFPIRCNACGTFDILETALNKLHLGNYDVNIRFYMQVKVRHVQSPVSISVINEWLNEFDRCMHTFPRAYVIEIEENPVECVNCKEPEMRITNMKFEAASFVVEHGCDSCRHGVVYKYHSDVPEYGE